jgi:heme-degrading monooxygenase HmoA
MKSSVTSPWDIEENAVVVVIFEVYPRKEGKREYRNIAASLREFLEVRPGFIPNERFKSLGDENKIVSRLFWESEEAVQSWHNLLECKMAQKKGKKELFVKYGIRVAHVLREYTGADRNQAPSDSNAALPKLIGRHESTVHGTWS